MKKRVLLPLLVAGMMVASVVSLDSCKKQDQASKAVFTDTETPVIDNLIREDSIGGNYECPYCHQLLFHGDEHWHYFGTPPAGFNTSAMMESDFDEYGEPHFWGVSDCVDGLSAQACPYTGFLQGNQAMINAILADTALHITDTAVAEAMLLPRFHAHRIYYRVFLNGGQANAWHVGGGVPGWPSPETMENP